MASITWSAANQREIQLEVGRFFKEPLLMMLANLQTLVPVAIELYGGSALEKRGIYKNIRSPDVDVYFAPTNTHRPLFADDGTLAPFYRPFIKAVFTTVNNLLKDLCKYISWLEPHLDAKVETFMNGQGYKIPTGASEEYFPRTVKLLKLAYLCENRIRLYVLESLPHSGKSLLQIRASVRYKGMTFSVLDMTLKPFASLRGNRFQNVKLSIEDGQAVYDTVSNVRIANLRALFEDLRIAVTNELVQYRATTVDSRKETLQQKIVTHLGRLKDIVLRDMTLLPPYKELLDANMDLAFVRGFQVIPTGTGVFIPLTANMPLYNLNKRPVRTRRRYRRNRRTRRQ